MVFGQTYYRKLRASISLWQEAHRFCWRYKQACLFPLGILVCYACLFATSISLVFLLTHHQLHTLRVATWIQHYGIHWYYFFILLAYYGCCNLIFSFFCIGLSRYIGHAIREEKPLSYWQSLKKSTHAWRYLVNAMLFGNPIMFILQLADFISENCGQLVGRLFGCIKKMARFIFLPMATFEYAPMLKIFQNASALWDERGEKAIQLQFSWIYGLMFLFTLIGFFTMIFSVQNLHLRILMGTIIGFALVSMYLANILVNIVFQTSVYFYLKGENVRSDTPFLPKLSAVLEQDFE